MRNHSKEVKRKRTILKEQKQKEENKKIQKKIENKKKRTWERRTGNEKKRESPSARIGPAKKE